jgi:ZIP family zinc transporter
VRRLRAGGGVIYLAAVLPFASTLLGGWAVFRLHHRLHIAMALAAGILVATALVDLIPESIELIAHEDAALVTGVAAVFGFLVYAAVDAFIHAGSYEHGHDPALDPDAPHEHEEPLEATRSTLGWLAPAGLIAHSILDGMAIGLGFEAGGQVGVIVTLAVVVHDFADGLNIVTVAFAGGRGRGAALALLALDAAATFVGIGISQLLPLPAEQLGILLGAFGGAFIAIGASHLLPEAEHRNRAGASPLVALTVLGAAIVVGVRLLLG